MKRRGPLLLKRPCPVELARVVPVPIETAKDNVVLKAPTPLFRPVTKMGHPKTKARRPVNYLELLDATARILASKVDSRSIVVEGQELSEVRTWVVIIATN